MVPPWETDRCAECGTTEDIHTSDVTKHPPLCPRCAGLWYGQHAEDDEREWLGP